MSDANLPARVTALENSGGGTAIKVGTWTNTSRITIDFPENPYIDANLGTSVKHILAAFSDAFTGTSSCANTIIPQKMWYKIGSTYYYYWRFSIIGTIAGYYATYGTSIGYINIAKAVSETFVQFNANTLSITYYYTS